MQPIFVSSTELKSIEHFASWVMVALTSLSSMEAYNVQALRTGILDEDEREQVATIMWEIKRLINQYRTLMEHLLERTDIDEQEILERLKEITPKDIEKEK